MSTPNRPIDAWPPTVHRGSPGYSARHYRALAGAPEDPLRVAERLQAHRDASRITGEARARLDSGEPLEATLDWQTRTLNEASEARWVALCASFDLVISSLESALPMTPAIRRLITQARRASPTKK